MPEELNIDDLIDLPNDEERVRKLRVSTPLSARGWACVSDVCGTTTMIEQLNERVPNKMNIRLFPTGVSSELQQQHRGRFYPT